VSGGEKSRMGAISAEQLLALNDEMAALVRAGVPLERGLLHLGQDVPGRVGAIATQLGQRMQAGESLADIIERDAKVFPPAWRAVVQAGMRSGHLASALEGMSRSTRRAVELRRAILLALVYPVVVLTLAYGVFLFLLTYYWPVIQSAYADLTSKRDMPWAGISRLGEVVEQWALVVPAVAVLLLGIWWYRSSRAIRTWTGPAARRSFRIRFWRWPTVGQSLRDGRMATFAELLALMNQHEVPMPEAIVLAADASGDRGLAEASREIARRVSNGEKLRDRRDLPAHFPPLLGWSIVSGSGTAALTRTLTTSAETYRQRAARAATWAVVYLPIALTAFIGGTVVFSLAFLVFYPIVSLLYDLALPQ